MGKQSIGSICQRRILEFLLCPCGKIGQNIVALGNPADASKDDTPDHEVPEKVEQNWNVGSSFLCQQE